MSGARINFFFIYYIYIYMVWVLGLSVLLCAREEVGMTSCLFCSRGSPAWSGEGFNFVAFCSFSMSGWRVLIYRDSGGTEQ